MDIQYLIRQAELYIEENQVTKNDQVNVDTPSITSESFFADTFSFVANSDKSETILYEDDKVPTPTKLQENIKSGLKARPAKKRQVSSTTITLGDYIKTHKHAPFQEMLFKLIDQQGLTDPEVYKRAQIDRKHFSKIRTMPDYRPSKPTVLALALALHLYPQHAEVFLSSAGYALGKSEILDLIIRFCLEREIYNIIEVNMLLDEFGEKTL